MANGDNYGSFPVGDTEHVRQLLQQQESTLSSGNGGGFSSEFVGIVEPNGETDAKLDGSYLHLSLRGVCKFVLGFGANITASSRFS